MGGSETRIVKAHRRQKRASSVALCHCVSFIHATSGALSAYQATRWCRINRNEAAMARRLCYGRQGCLLIGVGHFFPRSDMMALSEPSAAEDYQAANFRFCFGWLRRRRSRVLRALRWTCCWCRQSTGAEAWQNLDGRKNLGGPLHRLEH